MSYIMTLFKVMIIKDYGLFRIRLRQGLLYMYNHLNPTQVKQCSLLLSLIVPQTSETNVDYYFL